MTCIYGLIVVIALTVAIILLGITSLLSQISDDTNNTDPQTVAQDIPLTTVIHHHIVSGLESAEEGTIRLQLDAYDVNELLYALAKKLMLAASV